MIAQNFNNYICCVYFNIHLSCPFGSGYCNLEVQDLTDLSDDFEEGAIQEAIGRSLQDIEQMYASISLSNNMYCSYNTQCLILYSGKNRESVSDFEIKCKLQEHRDAILSTSTDGIQRINVRRLHFFEDAIAAFSRYTFDCTKSLKVRFIGEPAVDEGGPTREFFRLFVLSLSTSSLFQAVGNGIQPAHNVLALGKQAFKRCGEILAAGIVHGAQSPLCFTPDTAHFLVYGSTAKRTEAHMIRGIPDAEIKRKVEMVREDYCTYMCIVLLTYCMFLFIADKMYFLGWN